MFGKGILLVQLCKQMKTLFRGKFFQGIRDTLVLGFRVQYGILTRENEGRV